jgi:phage recombination protein Bet
MTTAVATTGKQTLVQKFAAKYSVDEAKFLDTLKATAFKQKDNVAITNEQMTMLLVVADQYGLNPFTKEIYAYPDKGAIVPVVSVDGWARIINENPQMDGLEFVYSPETTTHKGKVVHTWIDCIITRKDRTKPIVVREFLDEVMRTVSFATPWDTHPKRLHRHKTLIQCARLAFGFAGIFDQDEAERILEAEKTVEGTTTQATGNKVEAGEVILPDYPEADLAKNLPVWKNLIDEGKQTAESIEAKASNRYKLTEAQSKTILAMKPTAKTDPFVAEMEAAERNQGEQQ